jgi:hypothetical protein
VRKLSVKSKLIPRGDSRALYIELVELLDVVHHSAALVDNPDTKSELQEGLAHAEAALRRALAENLQ